MDCVLEIWANSKREVQCFKIWICSEQTGILRRLEFPTLPFSFFKLVSETSFHTRNENRIWRKRNGWRVRWRRCDCLQGNFSHQRGIKMSCWQTADVQLIINKTPADLRTPSLLLSEHAEFLITRFSVHDEDQRRNRRSVKATTEQHS